jgi:hypothetical protein
LVCNWAVECRFRATIPVGRDLPRKLDDDVRLLADAVHLK